jgi:hypothetical protein
MEKEDYADLINMMPSSWILSYDELKDILPLSWPFIEFGLVHGFIKANVAVCFCLDEISRKGYSEESDTSLLCATDDADVLISVSCRLSDDERNGSNARSQWMRVLLWLCCTRENDIKRQLDWVELIYAEFDYPNEVAPFVRYMPSNKIKTSEESAKALRTYLDEWRTSFMNRMSSPEGGADADR